jgi:predicted RNA binding protein YcfA (HicA-like mRNA interferase family)
MSGQECGRALERPGFANVRQRGSHVVMRKGERGCVVPMHRELKTGTLHGVLRQAGVDTGRLCRRRPRQMTRRNANERPRAVAVHIRFAEHPNQ